MKRIPLMFAALAAFSMAAMSAMAADLPIRLIPQGVTNTSPSSYTLPLFQGNGQLLAVQVVDAITNNTFTLRQIIPVTSTYKITNIVATVTYTTAPGGACVVTNGAYLIAGDSVFGQFTTASTGTWFFVRNLAK